MLTFACSRCGAPIPPNTGKVATRIVVGTVVEVEGRPEFRDSHERGTYCSACSFIIDKLSAEMAHVKTENKEG